MAIVVDETTFYTAVFIILALVITVGKNGGPKVVLYRVLGVSAFFRAEKQPDGTARRSFHRMKIVTTGILPRYNLKSRDGQIRTWFAGRANETIRVFGYPQWVYNHNDARPLPMEHVKVVDKEIEQTVREKQSDGTTKEVIQKRVVPVVVAGAPIDGLLIHSGFETKVIEEFNELGKPQQSRFKWGMMAFVLLFILILSGLAVYYSYYFGINTACAVHAHGVNCG